MKTRKARTKKAYARNIVLVFSFLLLILLNVATTFAYFGHLEDGLGYIFMSLLWGFLAMVLVTGPYLFYVRSFPPRPDRPEGEPRIGGSRIVSLGKTLKYQKRRLGRRAIWSLFAVFGCFWLGLHFLVSSSGYLEFYEKFCGYLSFFCMTFFVFSFFTHAWAWWAQRRRTRRYPLTGMTRREAIWMLEVSGEIHRRMNYACVSGVLYVMIMAVLIFVQIV
nr:hypothetical protein [uncultured Fretibacterium sp.]